jgi:7,8-dihydropterin-6-yl-methyl-4-(beta-D-ribofuranosyl)aminobenzene 5'-phosphate synthase
MKKTEITTLAENYVERGVLSASGLMGEQGLSFYLNQGQWKFLFDTGTGLSLLHNTTILNIPIEELNGVVISHGCYGHHGGLESLLQATKRKKIYVHPHIFKDKWILKEGKKPRYHSILNRDRMESLGGKFVLRENTLELSDNLFLLGPFVRKSPSQDRNINNRYYRKDNSFEIDLLSDEQVIAFKTPEGLVLVTACTHNGIINTAEQAMEMTGAERIHAILGGLHTFGCSEAEILDLAHWLNDLQVSLLLCSHCTGLETTNILRKSFAGEVLQNYVGCKLTFPLA